MTQTQHQQAQNVIDDFLSALNRRKANKSVLCFNRTQQNFQKINEVWDDLLFLTENSTGNTIIVSSDINILKQRFSSATWCLTQLAAELSSLSKMKEYLNNEQHTSLLHDITTLANTFNLYIQQSKTCNIVVFDKGVFRAIRTQKLLSEFNKLAVAARQWIVKQNEDWGVVV